MTATPAEAFDGKCVLITGAASGLGLETARLFAARNASLVLVDLDSEALESAVDALKAGGSQVDAVAGDVAVSETAERAVNTAVSRVGRLDVLFNNAAIDPWSATTLGDTTEDQWDRIMSVNVKAAYLFAHAALPAMLEAARGVIINTGSSAGFRATAGEGAYGISKAAVIALTRSLARDYTARGIRTVCVCPGILESVTSDRRVDMNPELLSQRSERAAGLIPMGREGRYREIAEVVAFLASERASFVSGSSLLVDGGMLA